MGHSQLWKFHFGCLSWCEKPFKSPFLLGFLAMWGHLVWYYSTYNLHSFLGSIYRLQCNFFIISVFNITIESMMYYLCVAYIIDVLCNYHIGRLSMQNIFRIHTMTWYFPDRPWFWGHDYLRSTEILLTKLFRVKVFAVFIVTSLILLPKAVISI